MKKIFLLVAILATAFVQKGFAQDNKQNQLPRLLKFYYDIKNSLVAGNAATASIKAQEFVKATNSIDYKIISEGNIKALLKDATPISESKDIKEQRLHFSNLSTNMYTVAKAVKLSDQPVYYHYCPMKKAYWLSNDKAIKNPYYGNAMLSCGNIKEIL